MTHGGPDPLLFLSRAYWMVHQWHCKVVGESLSSSNVKLSELLSSLLHTLYSVVLNNAAENL